MPEADMTSVNLAKRVSDEDQVYVSSVDEAPPASSRSNLLDINQASAEQLMALPGIGEVRSRAIVNYRIEIGRFQRIDQLLDVPGIGSATFEGIRDLVTLGT